MPIAQDEFLYLQHFMADRSANALGADKMYLVDARLEPIAKEFGLPSISGLVGRLHSGDKMVEQRVIDAMTTNETLWYRDLHPFEVLRTKLMPEIIERRRGARSVSIWSAACSYGQEIYSIAMMLEDHFPELSNWNVRLFATDVSTDALKRASEGVYSTLEVNRGLPAAALVRHFKRAGAHWNLDEAIRRRVTFQQLNLAATWPPFVGNFDLIFLRNVLIYFDADVKRRVVTQALAHLAPGGRLILGSAENLLGVTDAVESELIERVLLYRPKGGQ